MKYIEDNNEIGVIPNSEILFTLNESINKTQKALEHTNHIGRTLLKGIIYGIGFTIGTTVFAAFLLSIFWRTFPQFQDFASFESGVEVVSQNQTQ